MKKIMIAVFAIAIAAVAQAATVNWSMTSVTASPVSTSPTGYMAFVLDGAYYDQFVALADGEKIGYAFSNKIGSGPAKTSRGSTGVTVGAGTYAANDTASAFMVIIDAATTEDAKYFAYTEVTSTTIAANGQDGTATFGTFAAATAANGGWTEAGAAVPEPTSALMLLVGLAGLALKRKVA